MTKDDPAPSQSGTVNRRDLLRMGGLGLGAVMIGPAVGPVLLGGAPAYAAGPATRNAVSALTGTTDFWVRFTTVSDEADTSPDSIKLTVEVGNAGTAGATQPVNLILITPFYGNFHNATTFAYFSRYIVHDARPIIPEMIELQIPASKLGSKQGAKFDIEIDLLTGGPRMFDMASACIPTTADTDVALLDNEAIGSLGAPIGAPATLPPGKNPVNLYFAFTSGRLKAGSTCVQPIMVGNAGSNAATSNATFTYVSPYRVKVDRGAAAGLSPTYLHNETDIGIPDIMTFPVSALNLLPDPNLLNGLGLLGTFNIPLIAYSGAYASRGGKGFLSVGGNDFDTEPDIAMARIPIIQPM